MNCPKCNQDKELIEFSKNKTRKNGYNGWCKSCTKKKVELLIINRAKIEVTELKCIKCSKILPVISFHKHRRYETGYFNICYSCQKQTYKTQEKQHNHWTKYLPSLHKRIEDNIKHVLEILGNECKDCKRIATVETFIAFDLHHIDPTQKKFQLGEGKLKNIWKQSVEDEVNKCILLCACCHRLRHKTKYLKD